ncbi:MAG: integrase [Omnitrophica bacterium RIFCSPLOWO2_02_FULL_45_16]|nr:MAG: integrase [Omnitrophica bacterium RIFCSPLOWO2_02_FULL_45_16]
MKDSFGLSIRRSCTVVDLWRSTFQYKVATSLDDQPIRKRLKELAEKRRRFGCARLHIMLRREGFVINHKRTERIYKEEGLALRIRRRKKMAAIQRSEAPAPTRVNERWSMDFVSDVLSSGRKIRTLTIVDDYSRKCHRLEVDTSIGGQRVVRVLNEIAQGEGLPELITIDNGPEFISKALDAWAYQRGVKLNFIRPGKPIDNSFIESFNGKFRDECLNDHWFTSLDEARRIIEDWRIDYNNERPHTSLGDLTPEEFLIKEREKFSTGIPVETVLTSSGDSF